jgi:hypothetical protein
MVSAEYPGPKERNMMQVKKGKNLESRDPPSPEGYGGQAADGQRQENL